MAKTEKDILCAEILSLEDEIEHRKIYGPKKGLMKRKQELKKLHLKLRKIYYAENLKKNEVDYSPYTW